MRLEPHQPRKPLSFFCHWCDRTTVDSTKPETGTFHVQFGHRFNQKSQEYDDEEYVGVMFAVCKPCMTAFKKSLTEQS